MATGIKLTKVGNVLTAPNKDLAFSSEFRNMVIIKKGFASSTTFDFAHGLGYRPAFAGYVKTSGRYFLNYFVAPLDGYQFDNTLYGNIWSDVTNLNVEAATAGRLVYICYLNPGDWGGKKDFGPTVSNVGIKLADVNVLTAKDSEMLINSKFEMPVIIKKGEINVAVRAIHADAETTVKQTDFTDYKHGQTSANHVIMPDWYGAGLINLYPGPVGFMAPYVFAEYEVSINNEVIRCRVSRVAEGSGGFFPEPADAAATTVTFKFFLTNIKLP